MIPKWVIGEGGNINQKNVNVYLELNAIYASICSSTFLISRWFIELLIFIKFFNKPTVSALKSKLATFW